MAVLVVGSVGYDSVRTRAGSREDALGGSGAFFSVSCSNFAPVSLVGVVGDDFRDSDVELLESHGVDISGLDRAEGETFRWRGVYDAEDMNIRTTLETRLNVFGNFAPMLSEGHRAAPYLFLANIAPSLQLDVLRQMERRPHLVALDTMDYWIERSGQELVDAIKQSDVVFMDEREAKSFARASNAANAARAIHALGARTVVVKRGEYGALLFHDGAAFAAPALPLDRVVDPTGAGDAFAGGFMGYLSATGDLREEGFRRATAAGAVMGAFAVEEFSIERLAAVTAQEIDDRFRELAALTWLPPLANDERLPVRAGRDEGRNK